MARQRARRSGVTQPASRLALVCDLLNAAGAAYLVVGGFALALHGIVRATKDVDILIDPTVENARRVLDALEGLTYGIARELDPADLIARPLTIIGDDPRVDVLTLAWSVRYAEAASRILQARVEGVDVPYADLETLIRSKQTGRLQDTADIEELEMVRRLASDNRQ